MEQGKYADILVVDKPTGVTSFGVVRTVRRVFHTKKVGHTGTLDPMATGVLAICLGEATKIAGLILAADKTYSGTAKLGEETDTLDAEGTVVARADVPALERDDLERLLYGYLGKSAQVPPQFSAIRTDGKRAYDMARKGERVELPPRPIELFALELTRFEPPEFDFTVTCSKGTYIRSLVRDWGRDLSCGAHLTALRRTRSGPFSLEQAVTLDRINEPDAMEQVPLVPMDRALPHLPVVEVGDEDVGRLRHGQPAQRSPVPEGDLIRVHHRGELVALGRNRDGVLWPRRVFATEK